MKPFSYGLIVKTIYDDGTVYSPDVLDTSAEDMMKILQDGLSNIASVSLETNYPTSIAMNSLFNMAFKNVLSISLGTNYDTEQSKKVKEFLADPSKFAVKEAPKKEEKKEEKKVEKKEEKTSWSC